MESVEPMTNPAAVPAVPAAQVDSNFMAANASAAVGVTTISTPVSMSILNLVVLDHNCVRAMYDAYKSPSTTLELKQILAWNMIMALSSHAAKEEMVLYPVVRSTLGAAAADRLLTDHTAVKTMLATLDTMAATDPNFDIQLRASMDSMDTHMQEEETTLLPQLASVLSAETQLQLGIHFEAAKVRAPTRPHPEAANLPPFNETAFAAAKQVDVALDQARMPSLVPTSVGLSPLVSAALASPAATSPPITAAPSGVSRAPPATVVADDGLAGVAGGAGDDSTAGGGDGGPADAMGPLDAGLNDQVVDLTGDGMDDIQQTPSSTVTTMEPAVPGPAVDTTDPNITLDMAAADPNITLDMAAAGGEGVPLRNDAGMDDEDDLGAAGGMPGDLTGSAAAPAGIDSIGEGADTVTADDYTANGAGDADTMPRKRRHTEDLAPAGHSEPAVPLMAPGEAS